MENEDRTPTQAKNYYSRSIWWSETPHALDHDLKRSDDRNGVNGIYFDDVRDYYQEILTPEVSETYGELKNLTSIKNRVNDISEVGRDENGEYNEPYSRQILSTEIVEIVEDGRSLTNSKDRRVDDLYVAVGEDDMDVVKWALDHAVSPGARIFLVHVSHPVALIPTPVGMFERSQLTPQQVRRYMNEVNNKRKDLLQKYIQLSTEAKVTAETLLLESKQAEKAILDLISILNITNLVMGIKKLPYTRRNDILSKGEFIKKNAPMTCDVTLVYNGEVFESDSYKDYSKRNFFQCMCFSGCMREEDQG